MILSRVASLGFVLLAAAGLSGQSTWHVQAGAAYPGNGSASSPFPTIQAGIQAAGTGHLVLVGPGIYVENLVYPAVWAITVRSQSGAAATTISAGGTGTVVEFPFGTGSGSRLEGFTVRDGAAFVGGGIFAGSSPGTRTVADCVIRNNAGGGVLVDGSVLVLEHCTITANSSGVVAAGLHVTGTVHATSCRILDNAGEGVFAEGSGSRFVNCVVAGNTRGIHLLMADTVRVVNSVIADNSPGTGLWLEFSNVDVTLWNTLVWGNAGGSLLVDPPSGPPGNGLTADFCNIQGGFAGVNNYGIHPAFVNPALRDYHIVAGSPCRDTGSNAAPFLPATDFEGQSRISGGTVDRGPDEFVPVPGPTVAVIQPGGPGTGAVVSNTGLVPGREVYNIFSLDLCPAPGAPFPPIGGGPYLGLCAQDPGFLLGQILVPADTPPTHFIAMAPVANFGPFTVPPVTIDIVCFELAGGSLAAVSPVVRTTFQ